MCLREDQESVLQEDERNRVKAALLQNSAKSNLYDNDWAPGQPRFTEQELEALWSKPQSAEAVVTDRLHGMIFAH